MTCEICDKRRMCGNKVSHSNIKTRKQQHPNVQRLRAMVDGKPRRLYACTRCVRSGKVLTRPRLSHATYAQPSSPGGLPRPSP